MRYRGTLLPQIDGFLHNSYCSGLPGPVNGAKVTQKSNSPQGYGLGDMPMAHLQLDIGCHLGNVRGTELLGSYFLIVEKIYGFQLQCSGEEMVGSGKHTMGLYPHPGDYYIMY